MQPHVIVGNSSHGNSEILRYQYAVAKQKITEGYRFVAVEWDWPDCKRLTDAIKRRAPRAELANVLRSFSRWPIWVLANVETLDFVEWLSINAPHVGFYGLDMFSMGECTKRLGQIFPRCQDQNEQILQPECEKELKELELPADVVERELEEKILLHAIDTNKRYYAAFDDSDVISGNIRDYHFFYTFSQLADRFGPGIALVHNGHAVDTRYSFMGSQGNVLFGQLLKDRYNFVYNIGIVAAEGEVYSAQKWGANSFPQLLPPVKRQSWETELPKGVKVGTYPLRSVGVVYNPAEVEKMSTFTEQPGAYSELIYFPYVTPLHPL